MKNKAVSKYLRKARHIYRAKKDIKEKFMTELEDSLLCYTENHPDCTYQDLLLEFGSPSDIRESLSLLPEETLSRRSLFLYWGVISVTAVLAAFILYRTICYVYDSYEVSQGHFEIRQYLIDPENPEPTETPEPGAEIIYFD